MLDRLVRADGAAELHPDRGVLHGHLQRPFRPAELLGGERDRRELPGFPERSG
ncbi:hypothetical protein ACWDKQ_33060 [Saccharopolyspora sp. NPDC000995]